MTAKLEKAYADVYRFPETPEPPSEGKAWKLAQANGPIFRPASPRTDLPLVVFPGFTLATTRGVDGSAFLGELLKGTVAGSAKSESTMEVKLAAAETYGVPAIVSEALLEEFCTDAYSKIFCTDENARKQMSIVIGSKIHDKVEDTKTGKSVPRFSLEIGLITRVFLARSIHTVIRYTGSASAAGSTKDASAAPSGPAAAPSDSGKPADHRPGPAADGPNPTGPPGVVSSLQFGNSSVVSTIETLQRPVAFGFRSVRWTFGGAQ
ncbi:hypothetical protein RAD15_24235 [Bradyrhizobium sp. 14AA]